MQEDFGMQPTYYYLFVPCISFIQERSVYIPQTLREAVEPTMWRQAAFASILLWHT